MPIPLIPIAISLATKFAPALVGKLMGNKAEETAKKVVGIAEAVTGLADQDAEATINTDPALALQFQKAIMEYQLEIYREDTERLAEVNKTFRAELTSTDKYNSRWRATFGYCMSFSWVIVFLTLCVLILAGVFSQKVPMDKVTEAIKALFSSIDVLWGIALAVLGITVHQRSVDKKTAAGQDGFITSIVKAIRK